MPFLHIYPLYSKKSIDKENSPIINESLINHHFPSHHITSQQLLLLLVPCWAPFASIVLSFVFLIVSSNLASLSSSSFNFFCKSFVICCTFFSRSALSELISFSCFSVFCLSLKLKLLQFFNALFQCNDVLVLTRFLVVRNLLLLVKLLL